MELLSRGISESDLKQYAWDKMELLYKQSRRASASASMMSLDLTRAAVASTVSSSGNKLYKSVRSALTKMASKGGVNPEKVRKMVAKKIIAMGGENVAKPS